jgi:hypothetical protein
MTREEAIERARVEIAKEGYTFYEPARAELTRRWGRWGRRVWVVSDPEPGWTGRFLMARVDDETGEVHWRIARF